MAHWVSSAIASLSGKELQAQSRMRNKIGASLFSSLENTVP
jgi:hypothetical protein